MWMAALLTLLALGGVAAGVTFGRARTISIHAAAAGGGLLLGIALFWVIPEIAGISGWVVASVLPLAVAGSMMLGDRFLMHAGHSPRQGVIYPLLLATAVHSFVDGWSVRALGGQGAGSSLAASAGHPLASSFENPLAALAVPIGLALHKIPEGFALGWVSHRAFGLSGGNATSRAVVAAGGVELMTLIGAMIEPGANESGEARFGAAWTAAILAIISGSFLFLGFHALLPGWKRPSVLLVFGASFLVTGVGRA